MSSQPISSINRRLQKLRAKREFSIKRVAGILGVSDSTYKGWEYGSRIPGDRYPKLAEIFGVSLEELFGIPELQQSKIALLQNELKNIETSIKKARAVLALK